MDIPDDKPVTVAELADILRCSRDKVYRMANAGEIPSFKVGAGWRFFPSQVLVALTTQPADPWAQPARSLSARRGPRQRLS